jgi:transcriptional antiterminator RfaH
MPVLPLEPYVQPENLLASDWAGGREASRWWVLHVRPRAEKVLSRRLLKHGVPFFLPIYEHRWHTGRRQLCSYLPLFPGYVFLFASDEQRFLALETNLVVRCLAVGDQQRLRADLACIQRLMTSGAALSPEEQILPGTRVEIVTGPFAGIQGTVIEQRQQTRFIVDISFLQRGVSVQIDATNFRKLAADAC